MGRAKKQRREARDAGDPVTPVQDPTPNRGQWAVALATLVGVAALLAMTRSSSQEIARINDRLDNRLERIESRIASLADKVEDVPARAPRQRRPDPNKVYEIETAGAPAKGPSDAPVTIAEFSDFQ